MVHLYKNGMRLSSTSLLARAADQDFFGHDQRAKQSVREIFLHQRAKDVLVIDLPGQGVNRSPDFFNKTFSDIFHFSEEGHAWVYREMMKAGAESFITKNY